MNTITAQDLHALQENGSHGALIDVRTPVEFAEAHMPRAVNIPLNKMAADKVREQAGDGPVYVICLGGVRAKKACKKLGDQGLGDVYLVEGGLQAWMDDGLSVIRGKQAVSLERQVRIAAGLLIFSGSLLAIFVHIGFIAIPTFIGAGLTFAGITNTCAMGMMIARMPWNQGGQQSTSA
jgi:rhodanese-related sulfurtransferase